jgi:hypothetical protein
MWDGMRLAETPCMKTCTLLRASGALAMVFAIAACGSSDGEDPAPLGDPGAQGTDANGNPVVIGPDGLPVGPDGKALPTKLDGRFELSNSLDLTSAGIFPDMANDTLKALSDFREQPSSTIVELLQAANVPVVSQVLGVIPALIRDQVLGFIDDTVFKALYDKLPVTKQITGILDDLGSLATKFEVVTVLEFNVPGPTGNVLGTHQFTGVAYNWMEKRTVINAPDVIKTLELQKVQINAVGLDMRSPELESARLAVGDHAFKVPIGSFAVLAADKLAADKFGTKDLRTGIHKVVNCAAVAKSVAARCIGIGPARVCVGHESDINNLCSIGIDIIVSTIQGRIKDLDIPALHLKSGTAKLWDAPAPGGQLNAIVDRVDEGYWTAGVGPQDKKILATFTGRRVGEFGSAPAAR